MKALAPGPNTATLLCQIKAIEEYARSRNNSSDIDLMTIWDALQNARASVERELHLRNAFDVSPLIVSATIHPLEGKF